MTINQPGSSRSRNASMTRSNGQRSASIAGTHEAEDKLVIAVDFGTTFSGVATVYSATPDEVDIIRTWPGIAPHPPYKYSTAADSISKVATASPATKSPRRYPTN
jgi:hypothetical protein